MRARVPVVRFSRGTISTARLRSESRYARWRSVAAGYTALAVLAVIPACGIGGSKPRAEGIGSERPGSPSAESVAPPVPAAASRPAGDGESTAGREAPVILIEVDFEIVQVRVPQGMFSESGRIWNHLDEEAVPADTAVLLQRNGLRVGRGKLNSWPPIKALLETEKRAQTSRNTVRGTGAALAVRLNDLPRNQDVFLVRPGGPVALAGATFVQSTNYLHIEYQVSETDVTALEVQVIPEIREPRTFIPPRLTEDGWSRRIPQHPGRVLRELAFRMTLAADEFLAVGPSPVTRGVPNLVGSVFLGEEIDGLRFESMYFITPEVMRSGRIRALGQSP